MPTSTAPEGPRLRRALGLWDLVFYGIVLIQPTAPMPLFGVVSQEARGHVVTTILIAMTAMLFTAISYGRMVRAYPSAGSAYTYTRETMHPGLGFLVGWTAMLDYLLLPLVNEALSEADESILAELTALKRLKYHLVQRGLIDEPQLDRILSIEQMTRPGIVGEAKR